MAEVLIRFDSPVADEHGVRYDARVCTREMPGGMWEGWIEFVGPAGTETLRTPRETEQPDRDKVAYWASGLTEAYLEGALSRAKNPGIPDLRPRMVEDEATFDGPAPPRGSGGDAAGGTPRVRPHPVLDPLKVYAQGEDVLRKELSALSEVHLRNIIDGYGMAKPDELRTAGREALIERIVGEVLRRAG
jgi:hypothetical protein